MATIRTIYENGIFRPLEPVDLPEGSRVELHNLRIRTADGTWTEVEPKLSVDSYDPDNSQDRSGAGL